VFDSVLQRGNLPKSRLGSGAVITVAVHAAVLALAVWISSQPVEELKQDAEVKFFAAPPPPPPPPPPPAGAAHHVEKKVEKKPKKPQEIVQPKEIPQEKPKEAEPEKDPEPDQPESPGGQVGGVEGGVEGGTVGGQIGGTVGGVVGGTLNEVLSFGEGMTRPENLQHPPVVTCPRDAIEAHIEGLVLASCTITTEGTLKDCRIIKPLPMVEPTVLEMLSKWNIGPIFFQGRAVTVNYKIPIRLKCVGR
jgi:periplasmic protein TonB